MHSNASNTLTSCFIVSSFPQTGQCGRKDSLGRLAQREPVREPPSPPKVMRRRKLAYPDGAALFARQQTGLGQHRAQWRDRWGLLALRSQHCGPRSRLEAARLTPARIGNQAGRAPRWRLLEAR